VARLKLTQALAAGEYALRGGLAACGAARPSRTVSGAVLAECGWCCLSARALGLGVFLLLALERAASADSLSLADPREALGRLDSGTVSAIARPPRCRTRWRFRIRSRRCCGSAAATHAGLDQAIRPGLPSPRLAIHDPWRWRALVVVMLVAFMSRPVTSAPCASHRHSTGTVCWPGHIRSDAW